uniref:Cytochrome P450 2U1-like n=1 Tax=Phallusia mammillata TaxID=59560 RepID=A0A6F9D9T3_9ASCI|nr:cytochrome P450 2U1-like [Phallusia mammillata]
MQQEIDNLLGPDEQLTLSHRDLMPMSCAIIQEVMRCRTLVPFGVPHCTSEDVDFRQYRLPKNTLVSGNLWAVHNNPEVWDKPHEFNPYRHLDEDGKFVASPHVIPFGVGLRRCLGERIAKIEIFFFLVSLFRYFNVLPDPTAKKLPEIDKGLQMIVFSPHTYKVVLQKRLPA